MSAVAAAPIAHLFGAPVLELPTDLYIPPDALTVFLEQFEGPLDLLLYLIRRQNLNVLDIPMSVVTAQYLEYVEAMREHQLELAAEYLLMAALLIEIKSRLLLPRLPASVTEEEDDPRAELARRLLEYEQIKLAARALDEMPQAGRDFAWVEVWLERLPVERLPEVRIDDLVSAWRGLLSRASVRQHHTITPDELSVREIMSRTLARLRERPVIEFLEFFSETPTRALIVVQFLALLELTRESLVELTQEHPYGALFVRLAGKH